MSKESSLQMAIAELEQTKISVAPYLKEIPALQLRVETTITRLINGLKQVDGNGGNADVQPENVLRPLKNFMGKPIGNQSKKTVTAPAASDVDLLREAAKKVYETFLDREDKELMEAVPEVQLRAVAKLAGLNWVTSTKPGKIELKFIASIKEGIGKKNKIAKEKEEAELKENRIEFLSGKGFKYDDEKKWYVNGDLNIKDENLLTSEDTWNQFVAQIESAGKK